MSDRRSDPSKIGRFYRVVSLVASVVFSTAGVAAVFETRLEAGPVGLLVIALVLFFVAATGAIPRFKYGDAELVFPEAGWEKISDAIAELPQSRQQELAVDLSEYAAKAPPEVSTIIRGISYGSAVQQQIIKMTQEVGFASARPSLIGGEVKARVEPTVVGRVVDLVLDLDEGAASRQVIVETQSTFAEHLDVELSDVLRILELFQPLLEADSRRVLLLVTSRPLSPEARGHIDAQANVYHAWVEIGRYTELRPAVLRALGLD